MSIEAVIFDLDGTLVHTIEDIGNAANVMLKCNGLPQHTTAEYLRWIGNGAAKFIEHAVGSEVNPDQLIDYVNQFKEVYSMNLHDKSRLFEGIPELLDELTIRGIKLAILSNKPHHLTVQVASYYLSDWDFHPVFGQREHIPRKPDPAAAFEIAGLLKIKAEQTLFVGDSRGDIETAMAAGMLPVGVYWGYGMSGAVPQNGQSFINHPMELLALLSD